MKKNYFLLLTAFIFSSQAFAQTSSSEGSIEKTNVKLENMGPLTVDASEFAMLKGNYNKSKAEETRWFDYIDDARNFGETYTYFSAMYMWSDSLPLAPFDDPSNVNYFGAGLMFDPASVYLLANENGESWTRHTRYTVDSATIFYKYHNFGSSRDSVVVSFVADDKTAKLTYNNGMDATASVNYNPSTNQVENFDGRAVIYLDSSDNTPNFFSTEFSSYLQAAFELPVGIDVTPEAGLDVNTNLFAVAFQYYPGKGADSLNQPLTWDDSTNRDSNNLSLFAPITMQGTIVTQQDPSFNFGLQLFGGRYSTRANEWFSPSNFPGNDRLFNYVMLKIEGQNVGINEVSEEVSFALSPNPISNNQTLFADFKLTKSSNVTISISDLNGKELKVLTNSNYGPGEHLVDGDISELNSGVYFYNILTDYGSTSKRFIVQ